MCSATYLYLDGQRAPVRTRLERVDRLLDGEGVGDELRDVAQHTFGDQSDHHRPRLLVSKGSDDIDLVLVYDGISQVPRTQGVREHSLTSRNPIAIKGSSTSGFPHPT